MSILRFEACELDLHARRLKRGGQSQDIQPRVFDVLAYLVRERARVVSKEELIAAVWGARVLSPSVIARALMLVRRHIGDDAQTPGMVRTVHGVGYQFVAPVAVQLVEAPGPGHEATSAPAPPAVDVPLRIGLWRDGGPSGDESLEAIDLSLQRQLRERAGDCGAGLVYLDADEADVSSSNELAQLAQRHGVDRVVAYTISRDTGSLWLDCRVMLPAAGAGWHSLREAAPEDLARRLLAALSGDPRAWSSAVAEPAGADAFTCRICARALELNAWNEWAAARRLFELTLAMQPGLWQAEIGRLEALVGLRDPAASATALQLLSRAEALGHETAIAACRAALELSAGGHPVPAPFPLLGDHRPSGAPGPRDGERVQMRRVVEAVRTAHADLFGPDALQPLERATAECAGDGGAPLGHALLHLGALRVAREELPHARVDLVRAAAHAATRRSPSLRAHALALLGLVLMRLGHVAEAHRTVDQTVDLVLHAPGAADALFTPTLLTLASLETSCRTRLRRIDALMASMGSALASEHPARIVTQAGADAALGWLDAARAGLRAAASSDAAAHEPVLQALWCIEALRLDVAAGDWGAVEEDRAMLLRGDPSNLAPALAAHLERTEAARVLAGGRRMDALRRLLDVAAVAPIGRTLAMTRLDAAWLLCDAGEVPRAQLLWRSTAGYGIEHPVGQSVRARISAGLGDPATAVRWQEQALATWGGPTPPAHAALARRYREAALGRPSSPPPLTQLASASWWSPVDAFA